MEACMSPTWLRRLTARNLAAPDEQHLIQQASRLQIRQQPGMGLSDSRQRRQ